MRNLKNKSYCEPYITGSCQKRKREARDKVQERRNIKRSERQAFERGLRNENL